MNITLQKFKEGELSDFVKETNLNESIDYSCHFVCARNESENIIGVVGFNVEKERYPRLEHCIISPKYQKTGLIVRLLLKMEDFIFNVLENGCYLSYILDTDKRMQAYSKKWGMKPFQSDDQGTWFFKVPSKENLQCA